MRFWSGDTIKELKENQIFVFGSNPSGIHGAGAAKAAVEFGAQYGVGRGLQGQTYALITKNLKAGYHEKATGITYATEGYKSLSADQISENVKELYQCAKQHPDKFFIMAYKNETWPNGSSKKSLNGYTSEEMFDLFMNDGDVPDNVILHNSFKPLAKTYLENKQTEQERNMSTIPSELLTKAQKIKEIAHALLSDDTHKIADCGFLNGNFYDEEGDRRYNFDELVNKSLSYTLQNDGAGYIRSGYNVDKTSRTFSSFFSSYENREKSYASHSIYRTSEMRGNLVICNDGTYHIITTICATDDAVIESGKINKECKLYETANLQAKRQGAASFEEVVHERTVDETSHYYKVATISDFDSTEDFETFKLDSLRYIADSEENQLSHSRVIKNITESIKDTNHIMIECEYKVNNRTNSDTPFILEIDGNIFYYDCFADKDNGEKKFRFVEEGDDFKFINYEAQAGKDILQALRMNILTDYEHVTEYHNEIEPMPEPEPEPEVKKTRTFKPGR